MRTLPFALALAACSGGIEVSPYEASTLEAAVVQVGPEVDFEAGNRRDFVGTLQIEGADRDWLVTVETSTGGRDIDLHTPSAADLSVLDGAADVRVTVERDPASEELSLAITDGSGGVLYIVEPAEPTALTRDMMGSGQIGRGDDLGQVQEGAWSLTLTSGLLRTDTGDVELLPGEPQAVTIDGATYRAVLLASFEAEMEGESPNCSGARERLAYELLRTDDPALAKLVRPEGEALPTSTCGAAAP